jgi:hydroxymethylpyrimidine kinase/phosphomethylpyrimidine kinase
MPRVVLTIGGSDSGGGAGVQADLKTFSVLGLHGTSALTAVTAQNTLGVQKVFGLEPEAVAAQLRSITDDFSVAYAKTGMLFSAEIVRVVAEHLRDTKIPFVLDPVIEAEAGGRLLRPEAVLAVKEHLIPLASVVTPNIFEAEALTCIPVRDTASADLAAQKIVSLGAEAVIVKGGHLDCTDLLRQNGDVHLLCGNRMIGGNHGVGCTFSAALTSFLAQGSPLRDAAMKAKEFAALAVAHSMTVGSGVGPVNQAAALLDEAERFRVLCDLQKAVELLMEEPRILDLIPEVGSNIGMAITGAVSREDVAAVEGRLVRAGRNVHPSGCVKFGASSHIARVILAAMSFDPNARAAMNLSLKALPACEALDLETAQFSRQEEPSGVDTMSWGTLRATAEFGRLPDVIWDKGAPGKEAMLRLLGKSGTEVALKALRLARFLGDGKI